ncbi:hypothetical protein K456DRAFT_951732 [Colletotrichum gloeosporioides 23]|nr:hypothetical protein K456DRAFT_951732 [Colletotrichum gloeosporioides 23]
MWLACVVCGCVCKCVLCACPSCTPTTTTTPSSTWNPSNAISPALPWTMEPSPAACLVYDFPYVRCKLRAVCMVCLGCCPDSSSPHRACSKLASASRRKEEASKQASKQASAGKGKLKPHTPPL